jgi:hypothetical protein
MRGDRRDPAGPLATFKRHGKQQGSETTAVRSGLGALSLVNVLYQTLKTSRSRVTGA